MNETNKALEIRLKKPHANQQFIIDNKKRFNVIRCGRRFGKTEYGEYTLGKSIPAGLPLCWISTTYKTLEPVFIEFKKVFHQVIKKPNEQLKKLYLINGTVIDFWSFDNIESVRGSKYFKMILDESAKEKNLEYIWNDILRATLIDYKGSADFISTPKGDNFFRYLDNKSKTNKNWCSFHFSSYDNPKLDKAEIDEIVADLPRNVVQQEIYAEYIDASGAMLKRDSIRYYENTIFTPDDYKNIYIGVDLAISQKDSADYTAFSVVGIKPNDDIHYIHAEKNHLTFHQIIQTIIKLNDRFKPNIVGIENVAFQSAIIQELIRTTNIPVEAITPTKDKITRFLPIVGKYEQGLIYHSRYLPNYVEPELLSFPDSENDDIVDSLTYAIQLAIIPKTAVYFF